VLAFVMAVNWTGPSMYAARRPVLYEGTYRASLCK